MSARPLRAPCVELKYSSTVRPSLKFEMIGVSMISPEGLAIRPRMPASCLICAAEPRAPESAIMQTELIGSPGLRPCGSTFIISSATFSVQLDQTSTTLLYFSPWVIRPSRYCCSYSLTFSWAPRDQLLLAGRDDQVVLAERDAGLAGLLEAERHQPVAEDHRLLLAAVAVDLVDDVADLLLGQQPVDQVEADVGIAAAGSPPAACGPAWSRRAATIGLPSLSHGRRAAP